MEKVKRIAETVKSQGGRALVVGGFVRDKLLGFESKDIDIEVFGLELQKLKQVLSKLGRVDEVGESFAVLKIAGMDVSIPRKESKVSAGHRGFQVEGDPSLSFEAASRRRDFTINAMAWDPLTDEILDVHGGREDLQNGILRAVDEQTFGEDPLRALRAMQLAARFELKLGKKTKELCRELDLSELSEERIGQEWKRLLLKAEKPSIGLTLARELLIIEKLHPELLPLFDTPQEPAWHPEGSVWDHTKLAVDEAAKIIRREKLNRESALTVMLAVLCHDFGKPAVTKKEDGRIRSPGHAEAGVAPAEAFMKQLYVSSGIQNMVLPLIYEHMFPASVSQNGLTEKAVRRLSARLEPANIQELTWVIEADLLARGEKSKEFEQAEELLALARQLAVEKHKPEPLVTGKELLKLGYEEGPKLGKLLQQLYEAQLDGKFESRQAGLKYLKKNL